MDDVDIELQQSRRKHEIRRRYSSAGTKMIKLLNKYKMKLEFRCNGTSMRSGVNPRDSYP